MKSRWKLVLAAAAGVAIGAAGDTAIRGQQAKAGPGYLIAEVDVHDPALMQQYGAKIPQTLEPFQHQYLVRSRNIQALEGDPPKGGIVMIQFESAAKAREWYDSAAYAAIRPTRQAAATSRLFIVEGLPPQ